MDPPKQDDPPLSSPVSSQTSSALLSIPESSYLTVPSTLPSRSTAALPGPTSFDSDVEYLLPTSASPDPTADSSQPRPIHVPSQPSPLCPRRETPTTPTRFDLYPEPIFMSVYSATSAESSHSDYSNPPRRSYRLPSFQNMAGRKPTIAEKEQMIQALRAHHVNTLVELRRIEKSFATLGSSDVTEPMTAAWSNYVNSHNLLTELRGLTKNYPFSAECVEEAKRRVYSDPQSNRSWNLCWLVLSKIRSDQLIPYYAQYQASLPQMWGGQTPTADQAAQLTAAFVAEWSWAVDNMLRHWEAPPSR